MYKKKTPSRSRNKNQKHRNAKQSESTGPTHRYRRPHHFEVSQKRERSPHFHRNKSTSPYSSSSPSNGSSLEASDEISHAVKHIKIRKGQILDERYRVIALLGDGTFGRVVECEYRGATFAIKIIKPVDRYIESAKIERSIIKKINGCDPEDTHGIVRYLHSFYYHNHFCMVFKPLGKSLYDFLKMNTFKGFPRHYVQAFFKQILKSIGFLHKIGYTHTDLKPENILLEYSHYYEVKQNKEQWKEKYFLPCSEKVRIIDFGGATKYDEHHSDVINTRQYRSPEVILECCKWNQISDIWSIGCIIVELATGSQLFATHEDIEHLAMIEKNCGRYPGWMVRNMSRECSLRRLFLDGQIDQEKVQTIERVVKMPILEQLLPGQNELINLLRKCLQIDPNHRINCKEALRHSYFNLQF